MKQFASRWIPLAVLIVAIVAATRPVHAELIEMTKKVAGITVHYKVVLPNGYDPGKTYPAILALGGARLPHVSRERGDGEKILRICRRHVERRNPSV